MDRKEIEAALAVVVERLRSEGDSWWAGSEIAPIAYRRLTTFSRRNKSRSKNPKVPTDGNLIADLVEGLQSHFEPDVPYTHVNDWRALCTELVTAFRHCID